MENISKLSPVSDRDIYYYRQRSKNRLFEALTSFFAEEAERRGISKRDIAECLRRDPASITRWLTAPSNVTPDTISDLLLSLGAEMDYFVTRFKDRPTPNEMHPLIARFQNRMEYKQSQKPQRPDRPVTPQKSQSNARVVEFEPA